jgi:hypothetical protein
MPRLIYVMGAILVLGACSADGTLPDTGTAAGAGRLVFRSRDVHGSTFTATVEAMHPDGTGRTALLQSVPSGPGSGSALSPDGTKLAIGDPGAGINWFDLDSTVLHHVAGTEVVGIVSWTDDSHNILFDDENGAKIGRVNIDGTGLQILVDGLYPSSSGGVFAYQRSGRIWSANVDGTFFGQLDADPLVESEGGPPQMAPRGGRIALTREVLVFSGDTLIQSNTGLFVYNTGTRAFERLTALPPAFTVVPPVGAPAWSPSGDAILFGRGGAWFVVNADGSGEHQVIPSSLGVSKAPAWSPHGTRLAFIASDDVYVVNADGTGVQDLSNTPATVEFGVQWSSH